MPSLPINVIFLLGLGCGLAFPLALFMIKPLMTAWRNHCVGLDRG